MLAPCHDHQNSSHTDTSKVMVVFCSTTSPCPMGKRDCIHNRRLATLACSISTPLGRPVEPEVNIT